MVFFLGNIRGFMCILDVSSVFLRVNWSFWYSKGILWFKGNFGIFRC